VRDGSWITTVSRLAAFTRGLYRAKKISQRTAATEHVGIDLEPSIMDPNEIWEHLPRAAILSEEGSLEVLEEMASPPEDTPERRRTFERVRQIVAFRKRRQDNTVVALLRL
jgi:hypothetical protein